ncbi:MAG: response regulator transcription factor [Candidatus Didemnitutus sp.]|nr:response regulator transcription factor [Candidatus Didemnitutus sp.]
MPARILLVDDHPLFRAGVAAVLRTDPGLEICAEANDGITAREAAATLRPDVAVVDLVLGGEDGLKLVRELRRDGPALRIVVLTMLDEAVYRPKALQAGADAFLSKREGPGQVVAAVRRLLDFPVPSRTSTSSGDHELAELSERELQVFRELGHGHTTQEVAAKLGVSVKTIETHRESIKQKLGLPHANALIARAAIWVREQGLSR